MLVPYTRSTSLNNINNDNNQVPQPAHNPDSPSALALLDTTEKVSDQFERLVQDYESRIRSLEERAQAAEERSAQLSAANVQLTSDLQGKNQQLNAKTTLLNWLWCKFFESDQLSISVNGYYDSCYQSQNGTTNYMTLEDFKRKLLNARLTQPILTRDEIYQKRAELTSSCTIC